MCAAARATTLCRTEPYPPGRDPMSTGRQIVKRMFEVVDGQRWDEYRDVMTADVTMTGPFGLIDGPDAWAAMSQGFPVAVPDGRHTIERGVESGATVAVSGVWTGTS